jgi:hypothetical protein
MVTAYVAHTTHPIPNYSTTVSLAQDLLVGRFRLSGRGVLRQDHLEFCPRELVPQLIDES